MSPGMEQLRNLRNGFEMKMRKGKVSVLYGRAGEIIRDHGWFCLILLFAMAHKLVTIWLIPDFAEDCYAYMESAEYADRHGFFARFFFGWTVHFLYTVLLYGITKVVHSGFYAGKIISFLASIGSIVLTYRIACLLGGKKAGVYASFLVAFVFVEYAILSTHVLSGPLFSFFVLLAFYLYVRKRYLWMSLVLGVAVFLRLEAFVVCIALFVVLGLHGRWKELIRAGVVFSVFFAIWRFSFYPLQDLSKTKAGVAYLKESLTIVASLKLVLERMSYLLCGFSNVSAGAIALLCLAGVITLFWKEYVTGGQRGEKASTPWNSSSSADVVLVSLQMTSAMVILRALCLHPTSYRHFAYIAPFLALIIGLAIPEIEKLLLHLVKGWWRKCMVKWMTVLVLVVFFCVALSAHLSGRGVGVYRFRMHHKDSTKATANWMKVYMTLNEGDKAVIPLPSVRYFSNTYPEKLLLPRVDATIAHSPDRKYEYLRRYFKSNRVKYVAWTNMKCPVSDLLPELSNEQSFLYFRHEYSPERKIGYYVNIFSIGDLTEKYGMYLDQGWWSSEPWGRWMKQTASIKLYSMEEADYELSFEVESFHKPRDLYIELAGQRIASVSVHKKVGFFRNPSVVTCRLHLKSGLSEIKLITPRAGTIPSEVGAWRDNRSLTIAIRNIRFTSIPADSFPRN